MTEPTTLSGYLADLEKWGCELIENEYGEYSVITKAGGATRLENTSAFAAACEAWNLMKP